MLCAVLSAENAEKHQEKAVETVKESKNVVQGKSYVGGRECCNCVQHRRAAESSEAFPMGVPHKKKNKKDSVLSVLFFMCESTLRCT